MSNMEILSIFLLTLSLTAAQYRPRNPRFRNPGFRNVRTPLATSATRDRPFISIPIVLLPDGQSIPKPKHSTYHYVGHASQNSPRHNNHRNNKQRGPMIGKSASNYQVSIPPPMSNPPQKKMVKPPKVTASQLNSHLRNSPNIPKIRIQNQNTQHNQNQKPIQTFEQTQQMHQIQYLKQQQRNNQPYQQQPQQSATVHKQNVANFVNFATALASQQQNQPIILPTQTPVSGLTFQNQPHLKIQESYVNQKSLLSNHKLNNGVVYQHQVPSLQTTQLHYTQVLPNNLANHNNGYTVHTVHKQQLPQPQNSPQLQQQQQQQQQEQTQQTQTSPAPENQYLPASSSIRSNTQSAQPTELQNNVQYSNNQASGYQQNSGSNTYQQNSGSNTYQQNSGSNTYQSNSGSNAYQQNSGTNLRTSSNQNNVILLNNYNNQVQQNSQPTYVTSTTPQQPTPAPQVVNSYDSQSQITKSVLSGQQSSSDTGYSVSQQPSQGAYVTPNQATEQQSYNSNNQGQQLTLSTSPQTASVSYPSAQVSQQNIFSLQNTPTSISHISDPLSYFQYQTAQELPSNYASLFSQGQTSYLSTNQNNQQNNAASPTVEQSYTILPSSQNVFGSSSIPTIYVSSQQDENASNNSPSESEIDTYESYSSNQPVYSSTINQASQATFITPNIDKGYPINLNYLQSSAEGQLSSSSDSQLSQGSPSISGGHLLYTSSSPKQISFPQTQTSISLPSQQYSSASYQSSPTFISFSTGNSNIKSESQPALNYGQRTTGVVTPGTTYAAKLNQNTPKQPETSESAEESEESEYDDDDENDEEEASYKVVYIPLDILKNILSNSVENQ